MPNPRKVAGSVVKATEKAVAQAAEPALAAVAGRDDAPAVPGAPAPEPPSSRSPPSRGVRCRPSRTRPARTGVRRPAPRPTPRRPPWRSRAPS